MSNTCDFQITRNGRKYIINMSIVNNYLQINCYEVQPTKNNEFYAQYYHEQIKQFSPIFKSSNSIVDDFNIFKNAILSKKVRINKNEKNEIYLTFILEKEEYKNVIVPLQMNNEFDKSYIEYYPVRRLPTIQVKMKTIYVRRPTIYINNYPNDVNDNLFYSQKFLYRVPIINNNNIVNNNNFAKVRQKKVYYQSPQKVNNNYRYNSPLNSPERERIELINNGSPSKSQFNYTSYRNRNNSPSKSGDVRSNNINNSRSDFSTNSNSDYERMLNELRNELDKTKKNLEENKLQINKLINIITDLKSENEQLKNDNMILSKNQNLENYNDSIKEKLINEKNIIQNEFELYKKQKEEEIDLYKSQNDQIMSQINILQNENQQLKIKIQEEEEKNSNLLKQKGRKYRIIKGEIIQDNKELEFLTQRISKNHKKLTLNLLYKASVDSDKAEVFHRKCDNIPSSLVLVKSSNNKRFGGFTTCNWSGNEIDKPDKDAFIFSLDKLKMYDVIPEKNAIGCYPGLGPTFSGYQIKIYDNAFENGGSTYLKGHNYNTTEDFELTGGMQKFGVEEIEVYGVELE